MKWFRNKEMLQDILNQNKNELEKYKHEKIVSLLKDETNLIQDHLTLLDENEKLKKALFITYMKTVDLELLKDCFELKDYNDRVNFLKELTQQEFELLKEVLDK